MQGVELSMLMVACYPSLTRRTPLEKPVDPVIYPIWSGRNSSNIIPPCVVLGQKPDLVYPHPWHIAHSSVPSASIPVHVFPTCFRCRNAACTYFPPFLFDCLTPLTKAIVLTAFRCRFLEILACLSSLRLFSALMLLVRGWVDLSPSRSIAASDS